MGTIKSGILSFSCVLASIASPGAAQADCTIADKVETCSGSVTGAIVHTQNEVNILTVSGLTQTIHAADSADAAKQNGPVIDLGDPGGVTPVPSDWDSDDRNGQAGIPGKPGSYLSATVSLDTGYMLTGLSGIRLRSSGWDGSPGHEASHTDKHASGGKGGDGGGGGDLSLNAKSDGGGQGASAISGCCAGNQASSGITLTSSGGGGGAGGWADSKGGLKDSQGGDGGVGGHGGAITADLLDGHLLSYRGAGVGIAVTAQGGDGGAGGYGEVDGIDADSSRGGAGGTGGNGGAIHFTATSASSTIVTTGTGIALQSLGGNGGAGGAGKGGHDTAGEGGDAGKGGDILADLSLEVTTSGSQSYFGIYVKSAGGFAGDSGDASDGIKDHPGNPGEPGQAGTVTLHLADSTIVTRNAEADGILVHSVGGMGGNGGSSSGLVSYGSKGGSGGAGGDATVTLNNTLVTTGGASDVLETSGDHAGALLIQSIGGAGGKAGKASGIVVLAAEAGAGGVGGAASVALTDSTLQTTGLHATGVLVQSIGGGGGSSGAATGVYAVGGNGGKGGAGGTVHLTVDGDGARIGTRGHNAIGILLQSIGAGGGEAHSPGGVIALGQNGGGGGNGSTVTYYAMEAGGVNISTSGDLSDAILIQSLGGGGGRGGSTFEALVKVSSKVGSSGGGGGSAGDIDYGGSNSDVISTTGDLARGLVLQSIGGGGGSGGNIITISTGLTFSGVSGASSSDPSKHDGGTVTADAGGQITTTGDGSTGVLAQSVGGGGGSAGSNVSISVGIDLDHAQGASGQAGGDGGMLDVASIADISTSGADADGILVQSIGGGGGHSSNVVKATLGVSMTGVSSQQGAASGGPGGGGGDASLETTGAITTKGDNALGVAAQSIAGGGGKAGSTISATIGTDLGKVALGQSGGSGGTAGSVSIKNHGDVYTEGGLASAILAQSIGGGGGHGGLVVNGDVSALSASLTQGGDGGTGGVGGVVTVDNDGGLTTIGDGAVGIFAQSLGGGGGAGGMAVHGAFSVVSLSSNLGGNGDHGGTAAAVTVSNSAKVDTSGHQATGIFAQSLGGSGGKAGTLANGTGTGGEFSGSLTLSVGGAGGDGGKASDVEVDQLAGGAISTKGHNANGITVQSIGGDGGSGGDVYSGSMAASQSGSLNVNVSVGGAGGKAGKAGKATVKNSGSIDTSGAYAEAIFAQSVGGHGGEAGSSYAITADASLGGSIESTITVGGAGGDGAVASDVQVTNGGTLSTIGGNAAGIYAQSIGGNGGAGGYGLMFLGNFEATDENYLSLSANVEVGGAGGKGSNAGSVDVDNSGSITTNSDTSAGIYAQSIGGGGGDGGNAGDYTMGYLQKLGEGEIESKGFSLTVTVGGGGGGGGNGSTVTVDNTHAITTSGSASYGIFAQSLGGGGGSGGNGSPGLEGWVADVYDDVDKIAEWRENYEQIKKIKGKDWKGLFLESFSVDVGGSAGGTGDGALVSVINTDTIATTGDSATAIFAQSIGGGGGVGGDGSQGMLTSVTVSGSGGGGGKGGGITVDNRGVIQTSGTGAMGVYVQSLGGGGGSAGDVEGTIATNIDDLAEVLGYNIFGSTGGSTGDGGDGGDVTIMNSGSIVTTGVNAHGIWAQSVGGGGGAASSYGNSAGQNGVGSDGLEGSSGDISFNVSGTITVSGDGAHGIFVQSASGVGKTSYAGGIDLDISGSVKAGGAKARAILAQATSYANDTSVGDPSAGTVQITIATGATVATTNPDAYETIAIKGGRSVSGTSGFDVSNRLYNSGTLTSAGPDAVVLATDDAAGLVVHNMGSMSGSVSAGNNNAVHFYNYETGVFALGTAVNLGTNSGTFLQNGGTLSASGLGVIGNSRVTTGSFVQNSAGKIQVDLSKANAQTALTGDHIVVDMGGNSRAVTLDGSVKPNWVGGTSLVSGDTGKFDILNTAQGQVIDSAKLTVANSATVAYSLLPSVNGSGLQANYSVDYTGAASGVNLRENERSFASYFSSTMKAMPSAENMTDTNRTMSLLATEFLNTMSGAGLARAYGEHTLDESVIGAVKAVSTAHSLHSLLQSCPNLDRPTTDSAFFRQGECAWIKLQGSKYRQDTTSTIPGFKESVTAVTGAVQKRVGNGTFVEVGGKFEDVNVRGDNFSDDGDRVSAGVAIKHEIGIFTLSSTLGGGHYGYDKQRAYSLGGTRYRATADSSGAFVTGEARIFALLPEGDSFYVKPAIAISATRLWQDGYSETGSGPLNWHVDSISNTAVALHPSVEQGYAFDLSDRPAVVYARAGVTSMLSGTGIDVATRLVGDGASLGDLTVHSGTDKHMFELTGGIDMDLGRNLSLSIQAQTARSKNADEYGGFARMTWRF
jgi:hypothetical protein